MAASAGLLCLHLISEEIKDAFFGGGVGIKGVVANTHTRTHTYTEREKGKERWETSGGEAVQFLLSRPLCQDIRCKTVSIFTTFSIINSNAYHKKRERGVVEVGVAAAAVWHLCKIAPACHLLWQVCV